MIQFEKHILSNGLQLIVHTDRSTPIVAINVAYDVGARDEDPETTGLAHYFEHLMFSGSKNAPSYDQALQIAGADNNAFTTNDYTNYYINIPKHNWETGLWLESDRMFQLNLDEKNLEVQRKVVIEEFKQRYLNQPYGDAWMELRDLTYKKHPYRWATIGKEIAHIEKVTLETALDFYKQFYAPNNAILVVSGDLTMQEVLPLVEKWFGDIPPSEIHRRVRTPEDQTDEVRVKELNQDIPLKAFYFSFLTDARTDKNFFVGDLVSDILGRGEGSVLYDRLVNELGWASEAHAFVSGDRDQGMFVISAKIYDHVTLEQVEEEVWKIIHEMIQNGISDEQLLKVKNKFETAHVYGEINVNTKATNLAYAALLGDANLVNTELDVYRSITPVQVVQWVEEKLSPKRVNKLYYTKKND